MPKGQHDGRNRTRAYTYEHQRLPASVFKKLINLPTGTYPINGELGGKNNHLKLTTLDNGLRVASFNLHNKPLQVTLTLDNRSASNKLYLLCPHCQKQRQHLYIYRYGLACRECLGLHYSSQSQRANERLLNKIRQHRIMLWGSDWPEVGNLFAPISCWPKPKHIHMKTFIHKRNKILALEKRYWPMLNAEINKLFSGFDILN